MQLRPAALRARFASLTSRLVVTAVGLVAVVSLLIGTATTLAIHATLLDRLDTEVQGSLQRANDHDDDNDGPAATPRFDPRNQRPSTLIAMLTEGDRAACVLTETPGECGTVGPDAIDRIERVPVDGQVHGVRLPGLGSYRLTAVHDRAGRTVVTGLPTRDVDATVAAMIGWELLLTLLGVLAAAGLGLLVVRRQLRPLHEVAATAHTVAALPLASGSADIDARVPDHLTDERTEVGQVGAALNTLLAHVESSLEARHRSEQQVRQFVADASHELRTPLATIAGYTELARRRPDDREVTATALSKVEEESGRMTALVEDLLLLARLDSGRPLEREPVDLTRLLVEAVSDARVVDPDRRWRVDVPDDLVDTPAVVAGDELRLHQVVTNLLTNARKYTPPGTTVTVHVRRDGFAVHDDGPGFPAELRAHAFERFVRGDTARTRGSELGVGLGLALVEAIVSAHGGRVSLRSAPGDTTVDVTLPG